MKKNPPRMYERKSAKEYTKKNPRNNIWKKIRERRIFFRGFSFQYSFADFLSNMVMQDHVKISWRWCFLTELLLKGDFHSFEYSFADLLSNMVKWDHIKDQLTGILSDGTVTQGFNKSNERFNTLVYFLSEEIFTQIFFVSFLLNILSRIFLRIFFRRFRSNILLRIFFEIFFRIFSNILSRIFCRILFRWFSFEYSCADFLSNIFMRIFFRIFFLGFSFE